MKQNNFGELIYSDEDICDLLMQAHDIGSMKNLLIDSTVDLETAAAILENVPTFIRYDEQAASSISKEEFDHRNQTTWFMPNEYKQLDIAEYVVGMCKTQEELQRVGQELLLYQERDLFNLLRYLKYFVDVMRKNNVVWGLGRGSSVSSYVLYLLGVHKIDSLYYDLPIEEFLK